VVTVTLRSDSVEGLNSFLLLLQGLVAVAAFPAANLHSSEGALDSADFCDCLLCFRGAVLDCVVRRHILEVEQFLCVGVASK
jgi:hypothetical protein